MITDRESTLPLQRYPPQTLERALLPLRWVEAHARLLPICRQQTIEVSAARDLCVATHL